MSVLGRVAVLVALKRWATALGALAGAVAIACGEPLAPGTHWILGEWRLVATIYDDGDPAGEPSPAPDAFVLTLAEDGTAIVREYGAITMSTQFRTREDASTAGRPLVVEFDAAVADVRRAVLPGQPADALSWRCCAEQGTRLFAR